MTDEEMYSLSSETTSLLLQAKKLLGLHLLRYSHLVNNSNKGFDCTYSRITKRHFLEQFESERNTVAEISAQFNNLLESLDALSERITDNSTY